MPRSLSRAARPPTFCDRCTVKCPRLPQRVMGGRERKPWIIGLRQLWSRCERSWNIGFITQVRIESDRQNEIRVDAFPFFYELLKAFGDFFAKREFDVEIGEAWFFKGAAADGGFFELNIFFGHDPRPLLSKRLHAADVLLFLILRTGELASSLEKIEVDLEYFFTKFPIGIYRRGIR
jgi:hypothetical protein